MKRFAAVIALAAACMTPADDRARRDEQIGTASAGGASVVVADGLAAVYAIAPGEVTLWAGAPVLDFTLSAASATEWSVTVRNVLPDATLEATDAAGAPLAVTLEAERLPTEKRWRVASAAGEVNVRLSALDVDDVTTWRFAVLADVQDALDDVGDIYARMRLDPSVRFLLFSGDLTEQGSRGQLELFQRELEALPAPMYATLGNHELGTRDDLFHDFYGRGNWSFVFRGIRFTALDSASATLAPAVYDWLDAWLDAGRDVFQVVAMHIPPLDPVGTRNGAFASRPEAHALVAKLARAGVDVTFYGHLHSFYSYSEAGVPAYISGGGGAIPERFDGISRHYLTVDVDPVTRAFQVAVVRVD